MYIHECISEFGWKRAVFRSLVVLVLLFVAESLPDFGSILDLGNNKSRPNQDPDLKSLKSFFIRAQDPNPYPLDPGFGYLYADFQADHGYEFKTT